MSHVSRNTFVAEFFNYMVIIKIQFQCLKKRNAESIYILFSWVVYPSWSCGRVSLPWSAPTSWKRQQRATPCSQHPSTLDQSSINSFLDSGTGMTNGKWTFLGFETHHDACSDGDTSTAVRVGHNVSVADAQERDGDEPHGVEQVGVLLVVISFLIKKDFVFTN